MEIEQILGYDWKEASKRKPPAFEVLRLYYGGQERLGLWNGQDYYIFNLYAGEWKLLEDGDFNFQYATIPADQTKYVPYYALANSRKERIGNGKRPDVHDVQGATR